MITRYNKKWYKPRDIARLGLIVNSKGANNEQSNYQYILKLIQAGHLQAKDYSVSGKTPYWLVSEDEIMRYHGIK